MRVPEPEEPTPEPVMQYALIDCGLNGGIVGDDCTIHEQVGLYPFVSQY